MNNEEKLLHAALRFGDVAYWVLRDVYKDGNLNDDDWMMIEKGRSLLKKILMGEL